MKQGIKIFGLSLLAALSVMAATAVAAQAEGEVQVEGAALAEGEEAEVAGTGVTGRLVTAGGLTIECEKSEVKGTATNLKIEEKPKLGHGKIHVLYLGCKVVGNKFCLIYPTEPDRTAKSNAGKILASALWLTLLLSNPQRHYLFLLPLTKGGLFTNFFFTVGGGCTLPSTAEVSGTTAYKIAAAKTEAKEHVFEDITNKEEKEEFKEQGMELGLLFGKEQATLEEGNVTAHLIGEKFLNKKWSLN